jgi:hypothetical protein
LEHEKRADEAAGEAERDDKFGGRAGAGGMAERAHLDIEGECGVGAVGARRTADESVPCQEAGLHVAGAHE